MISVLLVNQNKIPHYRVPIYGYLSEYLKERGYLLKVAATGIENAGPGEINFEYIEIPLTLMRLLRLIKDAKIDIVMFWVNLKHLFLLPACIILRLFLRKKVLYWGHGRDLLDTEAKIKNVGYIFQQMLSNAIILYAEHLKKYIPKFLHKKVFIANNTLYFNNNTCNRTFVFI